MANCAICEKQLPVLGSVSIYSGKICKECAARAPSVAMENSTNWSGYSVEAMIQYEDEVFNQFEATASYGELHIDTIRGLFAISKKLKDDKPITRDVFSALDLSEVALYCKSPRVDNHVVYVDVEFSCRIEPLGLNIKRVVKHKVRCEHKRVDSAHVEWDTPGDLQVFIEMFNTMLSGLWQRMNMMLCGTTVKDLELEKARALFMLHEDYTMDDLKKARNLLMKVYHPDVAGAAGITDTTEASQIINRSFVLLKNNLQLKDKEEIQLNTATPKY